MSRPGIVMRLAQHGPLALAMAFVAMVAWEVVEYLALEGPRVAAGTRPLVLHSVQVVLVLAVTWAVVRAWQVRTRQQDALARMVEKVVMAQEEERRRIGYELHDGVAQLIVSAKQHVVAVSQRGPAGPRPEPRPNSGVAPAGPALERPRSDGSIFGPQGSVIAVATWLLD